MRIRTVKPEWLEDDRMLEASSDSRVLSIALILIADDYGNGRAGVTIAARVFPCLANPRETFAKALEGLSGWFVDLYECRGQSYYAIRNWSKHQRVDKIGKPLVPGPDDADSRHSRDTLATPERLTWTPTRTSDQDHDPDQDQSSQTGAGGLAPTPPGNGQAELVLPKKPRKRKPAATAAAWAAYSEAYEQRYGVAPARNAAVNSQMAHVVRRLGEEAPDVARFYLEHNQGWYITKGHPVSGLLSDAESLRMQWATGRKVTRGDAKNAETIDEFAAQSRRVEKMLEGPT